LLCRNQNKMDDTKTHTVTIIQRICLCLSLRKDVFPICLRLVPGCFTPITCSPWKVSRFAPLNRYYIIIDEVFFSQFFGIVTVCVFVCHMLSYHPFYFDFHSAHVIFYVSSGFYFWGVNRTPTWHLSKMFKVAFKDVSTKNSEPTYWTILFVMLKIYFIYKVAGKKLRIKNILCYIMNIVTDMTFFVNLYFRI
jgi:hypothetical protein